MSRDPTGYGKVSLQPVFDIPLSPRGLAVFFPSCSVFLAEASFPIDEKKWQSVFCRVDLARIVEIQAIQKVSCKSGVQLLVSLGEQDIHVVIHKASP